MNQVHAAMEKGLIQSCHDLSEGGLGLAISEMAFSGGFGVRLDLQDVIYNGKDKRFDFILFAESNTRFLLEVEKIHTDKINDIFQSLPLVKIGETTKAKQLNIFFDKKNLIDLPLSVIRAKWQRMIV
jgi:phosphoribosylformylglycinamidine synthase